MIEQLEHVDVTDRDSEAELISTAQTAVSRCNWLVGACAAEWTRKYARGRTDADFANLVGLSPDQVYQRRRVWETFGDVYRDYTNLKWSHFYIALNWDDAPECLQWADENEATVAEMRAWRRAQRGEDIAHEAPPDAWAGDPAVSYVPSEAVPVREPATFETVGRTGTLLAADREPEPGDSRTRDTVAETPYAPFRKDAGSPAAGASEERSRSAVAEKPQPTPEQLLKRVVSSLERINQALTPEAVKAFRRLPADLRGRFVAAVGELSSKAATLT
ncbi:MAG TPA: hypothetical protein VML55_06990 [Planctomycetaceae bacterium]|nr:hypothetical protein [Planctomycetaceae bacterium]